MVQDAMFVLGVLIAYYLLSAMFGELAAAFILASFTVFLWNHS